MRPYLALALFGLAALAAACGGGGAGSAPVLPTAAGPTTAPARSGNAKLALRIPAASAAASGRRAAYVSPNTQSVQVFASLVSATASPSPQTFAIATPSPCTQNADGSKTCTFNVVAPFGEDQFVIKTYATSNPGPTASPLAVFQSGAVNVAQGAAPPALSFTLAGVVASIDIAMPSPNPSTTPSTQIGTVGRAITRSVLAITPKDASGMPILSDTFDAPITVTLSPANAGVALALAPSQCSPASTLSGATAKITCPKDLAALSFAYDGTIARDASKNVIARFTFSGSTPTSTASGSAATLLLGGTETSYPMPLLTPASVASMRFLRNADSTFSYLINQFDAATIGHFDPSNPASTTGTLLPYASSGMTVDHQGDIWVAETTTSQGGMLNAIDCYQAGSTTPRSSILIETPSSPVPIQPAALTTDASGNIWYFGMDTGGNEWAGSVGPDVCASAPPFAQANAELSGALSDPYDAQPQKGGGVLLLSRNSGLYSATTSTSGTVNAIATPATFGYGEDFSVDSAGNSYVDFASEVGPFVSTLPFGAGAFTTAQQTFNSATPLGISTDGGAPASSFAFGDNNGNIAIGDAPGLNHLALLYAGSPCFATFFDANNDVWGACSDGNTVTFEHFIRTSTWTVMVPPNLQIYSGETVLLPILEKGYSGPFTATVSDSSATVASPQPGYEHVIPVKFTTTSSGADTMTVTDHNGLSQTIPLTWSYTAGARRRTGAPLLPHVRGMHLGRHRLTPVLGAW